MQNFDSMKAYNIGDHHYWKSEFPLFRPNLPRKITSECEHCETILKILRREVRKGSFWFLISKVKSFLAMVVLVLVFFSFIQIVIDHVVRNSSSEAGRWKTLGVPVVIGGDDLPSPVQIGLNDLHNIEGASGPPGPPVPASLSSITRKGFILSSFAKMQILDHLLDFQSLTS